MYEKEIIKKCLNVCLTHPSFKQKESRNESVPLKDTRASLPAVKRPDNKYVLVDFLRENCAVSVI